jgi:hypothetical protein
MALPALDCAPPVYDCRCTAPGGHNWAGQACSMGSDSPGAGISCCHDGESHLDLEPVFQVSAVREEACGWIKDQSLCKKLHDVRVEAANLSIACFKKLQQQIALKMRVMLLLVRHLGSVENRNRSTHTRAGNRKEN